MVCWRNCAKLHQGSQMLGGRLRYGSFCTGQVEMVMILICSYNSGGSRGQAAGQGLRGALVFPRGWHSLSLHLSHRSKCVYTPVSVQLSTCVKSVDLPSGNPASLDDYCGPISLLGMERAIGAISTSTSFHLVSARGPREDGRQDLCSGPGLPGRPGQQTCRQPKRSSGS